VLLLLFVKLAAQKPVQLSIGNKKNDLFPRKNRIFLLLREVVVQVENSSRTTTTRASIRTNPTAKLNGFQKKSFYNFN
jgi:hypothetical protein